MTDVTIYYLEMNAVEQLIIAERPVDLQITEAEIKQYRFNRYLYELVGADWQWLDKIGLSDKQWQDYAEAPELHTWVAYYRGSIAGYYELQEQAEGNVELCYFGLAPGFIGKGFGGCLLSHALQTAWKLPSTRRVWVHTCSLDHPAALANYQARGLTVYQTETVEV